MLVSAGEREEGAAGGHWHTHADGTTHAHAPQQTHPHDAGGGHGPSAAGPIGDAGAGHFHGLPPLPRRNDGGARSIELGKPILERNQRLAERNRGFFRGRGLAAFNLISSPGSGKTTLLERTLAALSPEIRGAVVVGDLATARDAERVRAAGAAAVQITTGTVCHLDAEMVARGLEQLDLGGCRVVWIENVGNLVCPSDFDLGEGARVVLLSVTEGEDKPLKYPPVFRRADAVVLTKADLVDACGVDLGELRRNVARMAPQARCFEMSARTGLGMEAWLGWVRERVGTVVGDG